MADRPIDLDTPVQFVRGVGPMRAEAFRWLGVATVGDLIEHLPHRYDVIPRSVPIDRLRLDEVSTVIGAVKSIRVREGGSAAVDAELVDGTGQCRVRWFHSEFVADKVGRGTVLRLTGKVDVFRDLAQFVNPRFEIVEEGADAFATDVDRFEPVYPAVAQLPSNAIRRIICDVLSSAGPGVVDPVPESLRRKRKLLPRAAAIATIHCPAKQEDAIEARRRLAYDELLVMQLAVQSIRRNQRAMQCAQPLRLTPTIDERIRKRFPFSLTPGQNAAVKEITADLAQPRPMNRLLQGDVGSGKTAVAIYAALLAIAERRQTAILAPTEILAEQHHRKAMQYLDGSRVRIGLLTGGTSQSRRTTLLRAAVGGELDLLIGTHALIEKDVTFGNLGLVVIDEQHRFGVAQRAAARGKGTSPHTLVMTATPIPRTLAMTYFGDLDITTIRDAPPGRRPIDTRIITTAQLSNAWRFVRERLAEGRQAYVVYPLVEESEMLPLKAAMTEFDALRAGPLAGVNVGLIHGRLPSGEKERVMNAFRDGAIHVLVSTTVIEVGVDVPNATIMVVQHAERYGLSQLHQLRGRIGRGTADSHCLLVCDARHGDAAKRLDIMRTSADGFAIAEFDLRLRGPGELLGTRQHGLPRLRAANLLEDVDLLDAARDDAAQIVGRDPGLRESGHAALRDALRRRHGGAAAYLNVG